VRRNDLLRFIVASAMVLAVAPWAFGDNLQGQPAKFLFNLDAANSAKVANSPIGTEVIFVQDGHLFHYFYDGNYYLDGPKFGGECFNGGVGDCHIAFGRVEDWGQTDQPEGRTVVVAPDQATYDHPSGPLQDPTGNAVLIDGETPTGNAIAGGQQNSGRSGQQTTQGGGHQNIDGQSLAEGAREVVGSAGQAALAAGAATYLVEKLGGEQVRQAQENVSRAAQDLNGTVKKYDATKIATVNTGLSILAHAPQFNVSIPVISTGSVAQSSNINLTVLRAQLSGFDSRYSSEVMRVAQQLNSVNDNSEVRRATFKEIGKASLRSSVENRALGWIPVSDAQLKMASVIGEMLVRSLPVTGLYTSLFEVWTGKNMFTGDPLSNFDRGFQGAMAVMDAVSLGLVPTIVTGVRAISMIAIMGEETALTTAADAIPVVSEVAGEVAELGINNQSSLKSAENLLRNENRDGHVASAEQAESTLSEGLESGQIPKAAKITIPQKALDTLKEVRETGKVPAGYEGGRVYKNIEGRLPSGGTYREYDVDPKPSAGARNAERIVVDQASGRAWYTSDHYASFSEIK
jgi:guanyl-specific ribonuclease Sa